MLVRFAHPGTHPAGFPGDDLNDTTPAGLPTAQPAAWPDGKRWAWSLGQGSAYWAGVERVLTRPAWTKAWTRSFFPERRPHLRRRLALNDFFTALHHSSRNRPDIGLDQWWGPVSCADASGGRLATDAHGRWHHLGATVPFWIYSDYARDKYRTLITTVEKHLTVHRRTADRDVILLVMNNDTREAHLHERWAAHTANGAPVPRVATTSYRKLRAWPTEAIWWPVNPGAGTNPTTSHARRLHQLAAPAPTGGTT